MKEINSFIYAQFIGILEKLESGHIPGRLDSRHLDAWTLDKWMLALRMLGRLDSGCLDAWTLDRWTQKILSILVKSFLLLLRHII